MRKIIFIALAFLLSGSLITFADQGVEQSPSTARASKIDQALEAKGEYRQKLRELVTIEKEEQPQQVESYVRWMPKRRAKNQDGNVGVVDAALEYSYMYKAFGKLPIQFGLQTGNISLNNSTSVKLPAHLTSLAAGVEVTAPFFTLDKTYLRVGVYPAFYSDNYSFHSSAFRIPSRFMGIWQPNDQWTWVLGVAVMPDFNPTCVPIFGFIYKPSDKLEFNIVPSRPTITYKLNDKFSIFAEGGITSGEYEVGQNGNKGLILEYNESHVGGGLKYQVNKNIKASLSAGGMFGRSLEYREDVNGKVALKGGPYTELRVEIGI